MMKQKIVRTALLSIFLLSTTSAFAADRVLAKYDGKELHKNHVEEKLKLFSNGVLPEGKKDFDDLSLEIKQRIITMFVHQALAEDAMQKSSVKNQEKYKKQLAEIEKEASIGLFLDYQAREKLTESMVKADYDKYVKELKSNDELKVSHILVKTEDEAKNILKDINSGKVKFEDAAKAHSTDGAKNTGGEIGYISKGQMIPEFEKAAYELKKDKVSDPVKTEFGWHLIKVTDIRKKQIPKFDEIKPQLEQAALMKIKQDYMNDLVKNAKIEAFPDPEKKS